MKHKLIIIIVLLVLLMLIANVIFYNIYPKGIAVLGYHGIVDKKTNNIEEIYVKKFERQMKYLKKHNYDTLTLDDMKCYMDNKCSFKRKSVLITFDDGYEDNYNIAFPILKKYNFNAVVFVIGSNINKDGYLTTKMIEDSKKEYPNITFASHTYNMHFDGALNLTYKDYYEDYKKEKELLNTKYHAYPYGLRNKDMVKALKDNGYKLAFGFGEDGFRKANRNDNKFNIPRLSIDSNMPLWKFKLRLLLPY